jgi:hypothetical protein
VLELLCLLFTTVLVWLRPRHDIALENLLLRHRLAVLTRPTRTHPRRQLRSWDRVLWVLARRFCGGWREQLSIVTPDTVVRWHRQGWRLFWRWTSRSRGGRPHLSPEARDLILTMSREIRLWGTERIRGELLKLGIVVSNRSIRRYRWRGPARSPNQTWRTFLHNHAHHLWAADLFTLPMLTFETLYVLVFIAHGRRELVYLNVTANPTAAWVWRQLVESTPGEASRAICSASRYGLRPRLSSTDPTNRYRCHRYTRSVAACECDRRESHQHTPERVSGPHDRPRRAPPVGRASRIRHLLQPGAFRVARSGCRRPNSRCDQQPARSGRGRC